VLVERHQEGLALMIEDDEQRVAFEPGPRSLSERIEHRQPAEIFLPDQPAVEGVGVESPRAEERVNVPAVGDG
jgi:hypothetical protein